MTERWLVTVADGWLVEAKDADAAAQHVADRVSREGGLRFRVLPAPAAVEVPDQLTPDS